MRSLIALPVAAALLAGCASNPKMTQVPGTAPIVAGTVMDASNQSNVRTDPVVQTLAVGPSVDPSDPNVRHDAHNVERVVENDQWNLHPNVPTAINMGPVVAVTDPNTQNTPLPPELEQKIQQENQLLQVTTEQNDAMTKQIAALQDAVKSKSNTDQENADLKASIAQLQQQVQDLQAKQQQAAPQKATPTVTPAPKSWWQWSK